MDFDTQDRTHVTLCTSPGRSLPGMEFAGGRWAYELRGQIRTRQAQEQQHQQVVETREAYKHQLHLVQVASEEEKMGPLRAGTCRMTSAEVASFDGMWTDPGYTGKYPWLQDVMGGPSTTSAFVTRGSHRSSPPTNATDRVEKAQVSSEELPMEEVVSELQRQRDIFLADMPEEPAQHFKTPLRGGAWTAMHIGTVADSARAFAATAEAKQFCQEHGLPQSATFALSRFGSRACALLSQYWVSKMNWLMAGGLSSAGASSAAAPPAAGTSFAEPAFVSELANGPAHTSARLAQLRSLATGH